MRAGRSYKTPAAPMQVTEKGGNRTTCDGRNDKRNFVPM